MVIVVGSACASTGTSGSPAGSRAPRTPASFDPGPTRATAAPSPTAPRRRPEGFAATVHRIGPAAARRMTSWHAGCPVPLDQLRMVTIRHWGFDGRVHSGRIVVHADVARRVVTVFRRLFEARFPIERMAPVEAYGDDDARVMAANDTSGFNCRAATGQPGVWSEHSYGRAIDVNPVQNPYVDGATVLPEAGRVYLDRSAVRPGMIRDGDVVVRAFAAIGWAWGGHYRSLKDYQHFSVTGR